MAHTFKAIVDDISGRKKPNVMVTHGVEKTGSSTPTKETDEKLKTEEVIEHK